MRYDPSPINTNGVDLSETLLQLTEQLAEHTHDVWAQGRFAQGWKYGTKRDDDKKEHPGLVPYAQLSEEEKQYDRNTALGTLKAIIALGYAIEEKPASKKPTSKKPTPKKAGKAK